MRQTYQGIAISGSQEGKWLVSEYDQRRQALHDRSILCLRDSLMVRGYSLETMPDVVEYTEERYVWSAAFYFIIPDCPGSKRLSFGIWHAERVNLNRESVPDTIREKATEIVLWMNDILLPRIRCFPWPQMPFWMWPESEQMTFIKETWELSHTMATPPPPQPRIQMPVMTWDSEPEERYSEDMPGMTLEEFQAWTDQLIDEVENA